jgi:hypothetical protein
MSSRDPPPDADGTAGPDDGPNDHEVYDHVRATDDADVAPGVYRVVGTPDDALTLLRVGDADGQRQHTGDVVSVPRSQWSTLEPAENPDGNRSVSAAVRSQLQGLFWTVRLLGRTVVERPLPAIPALALVVVGLFGDPFVPIPPLGDGALVVVGAFALLSLSRSG